MAWQLMIWTAGAVTAVALAVVGLPAVVAARHSGSVPSSVPAAATVLIALVTVGVTLTGEAGLPMWARAAWMMALACVAGWIAWHGRGLASRAKRAANPATSTSRTTSASRANHLIYTRRAGHREEPNNSGEPDEPAQSRMCLSLADQDDLVQSLTIASYALQLGDARRAHQAVDVALRHSRATLDRLLRENGGTGLVRAEPAVNPGLSADPGLPAEPGSPARPRPAAGLDLGAGPGPAPGPTPPADRGTTAA